MDEDKSYTQSSETHAGQVLELRLQKLKHATGADEVKAALTALSRCLLPYREDPRLSAHLATLQHGQALPIVMAATWAKADDFQDAMSSQQQLHNATDTCSASDAVLHALVMVAAQHCNRDDCLVVPAVMEKFFLTTLCTYLAQIGKLVDQHSNRDLYQSFWAFCCTVSTYLDLVLDWAQEREGSAEIQKRARAVLRDPQLVRPLCAAANCILSFVDSMQVAALCTQRSGASQTCRSVLLRSLYEEVSPAMLEKHHSMSLILSMVVTLARSDRPTPTVDLGKRTGVREARTQLTVTGDADAAVLQDSDTCAALLPALVASLRVALVPRLLLQTRAQVAGPGEDESLPSMHLAPIQRFQKLLESMLLLLLRWPLSSLLYTATLGLTFSDKSAATRPRVEIAQLQAVVCRCLEVQVVPGQAASSANSSPAKDVLGVHMCAIKILTILHETGRGPRSMRLYSVPSNRTGRTSVSCLTAALRSCRQGSEPQQRQQQQQQPPELLPELRARAEALRCFVPLIHSAVASYAAAGARLKPLGPVFIDGNDLDQINRFLAEYGSGGSSGSSSGTDSSDADGEEAGVGPGSTLAGVQRTGGVRGHSRQRLNGMADPRMHSMHALLRALGQAWARAGEDGFAAHAKSEPRVAINWLGTVLTYASHGVVASQVASMSSQWHARLPPPPARVGAVALGVTALLLPAVISVTLRLLEMSAEGAPQKGRPATAAGHGASNPLPRHMRIECVRVGCKSLLRNILAASQAPWTASAPRASDKSDGTHAEGAQQAFVHLLALHAVSVPSMLDMIAVKVRWGFAQLVLAGAEEVESPEMLAYRTARLRRSVGKQAVPCIEKLAHVAAAAAREGMPPYLACAGSPAGVRPSEQGTGGRDEAGCEAHADGPAVNGTARGAKGCTADQASASLAVASICSSWLASLLSSGVLQMTYEDDHFSPLDLTKADALGTDEKVTTQHKLHMQQKQQGHLRGMLHRLKMLQPTLARLLSALTNTGQRLAEGVAGLEQRGGSSSSSSNGVDGGDSECGSRLHQGGSSVSNGHGPHTHAAMPGTRLECTLSAQAHQALWRFADLLEAAHMAVADLVGRLEVAYVPAGAPSGIRVGEEGKMLQRLGEQRKQKQEDTLQGLMQRRGHTHVVTLASLDRLMEVARDAIACTSNAAEALQEASVAATSAMMAGSEANAGAAGRTAAACSVAAPGSSADLNHAQPDLAADVSRTAEAVERAGASGEASAVGSVALAASLPVTGNELLLQMQALCNDWALFTHCALTQSNRSMAGGTSALCGNVRCEGASHKKGADKPCPGRCGISFCSEACLQQAKHAHEQWCKQYVCASTGYIRRQSV